jgi:hypothetical protein
MCLFRTKTVCKESSYKPYLDKSFLIEADSRMLINIGWERKVGKVWSRGVSLGDIDSSVSCAIQKLTWQ